MKSDVDVVVAVGAGAGVDGACVAEPNENGVDAVDVRPLANDGVLLAEEVLLVVLVF